jgi:drug/metabolite transporter (DMT)-like permease
MALSDCLGHVLMNWSLRHIPVWVGGTCTLAVDVLASVLAVMLLGERMVPIETLGVLIVVAALMTVTLRSSRVAATPDEAGA